MNPNFLYRYKASDYGGAIILELDRYPVLKATKCGVWIQPTVYPSNCKKFVNLNARKQWACRTPEEAFISYQHRKARQISILEAQLRRAKQAAKLTPENTRESYSLNIGGWYD